MKNILLGSGICAVLVFAAASHAPQQGTQEKVTQDKAQDPEAKKRLATKARKLLELTGAGKMGKQILDQMMTNFARNPNLPAGFAETFKKHAKPEGFVDLIVPIYVANADEKVLDEVIKFFASPAGKSWIAIQPKIAQQSMAAGQEWGRELAMKTLKELEKGK